MSYTAETKWDGRSASISNVARSANGANNHFIQDMYLMKTNHHYKM